MQFLAKQKFCLEYDAILHHETCKVNIQEGATIFNTAVYNSLKKL